MADLTEIIPALVGFLGGGFLGVGVGVAYFAKADRAAELWVRVLGSAFGPAIALIFAAAIFWPESYRYQPNGVRAFYWLQGIPALLLGFTLAKYPGPRRAHWLLVPTGLLAWLWTFALGWLAVHGE